MPRSFQGDFFPSRITESASSGYSSSSIESHLLQLSSADSADEASPSPASSRSNSGLERLEETVLAESEESSSNDPGRSSPEEEEPVSWDQYSSLVERSRELESHTASLQMELAALKNESDVTNDEINSARSMQQEVSNIEDVRSVRSAVIV